MRKLIPSKKQYEAWSLPSKYSLIGLVVGLIGLGLAVVALLPRGSQTELAQPVSEQTVIRSGIKVHRDVYRVPRGDTLHYSVLDNDFFSPTEVDHGFKPIFTSIGSPNSPELGRLENQADGSFVFLAGDSLGTFEYNYTVGVPGSTAAAQGEVSIRIVDPPPPGL